MSDWKPTRWQRRDDNGYDLTVLQQGDRFTWTVELGFMIRIDETYHREVAMREAEEFAQDDYENQFMAIGEKQIETRGKRIHHRGPLAIHAARRWEADQVEFCRHGIPAGILARTGYTYLGGTNLPLGAIVAVVELVDCIPISDPAQCGFDWLSDRTISDTEKALGNYSPGRFAWLTTNRRQIHPPIPYRGAQWLFDIEDAIINEAISSSS